MSALLSRVRKLETACGGSGGVADGELAEADRIAERRARLLISETFAITSGKVWEPDATERAEIEDLRDKLEWALQVRRRHWEMLHPGRGYDQHLERCRRDAMRHFEETFGEVESASN